MVRILLTVMMLIQLGTSMNDAIHVQDHLFLQEGDYTAYEDVSLGGMIVPHHIVPYDKLTNMYETASDSSVSHVVLISPDHFTNSDRPVLTTQSDFYGDFGYLRNDKSLTKSYLSMADVFEDDAEIAIEHGLTVHLPLIKRYFKNAEVTVLAVSKQTTRKTLDEMIAKLPNDCFLIASVDFSHYYNYEAANAFDAITEAIIRKEGYDQFFGMSDAYFDSPGVLYMALVTAKRRHYDVVFYDHSNSAEYMSKDLAETTSYFFIGFTK